MSSRSHIGEEAGLAMPLNISLLVSFPSVIHTHAHTCTHRNAELK